MNEAVTKLLEREKLLEVELSNVRRNIEAARLAATSLDGLAGALTFSMCPEGDAFAIIPRITIDVCVDASTLELMRPLFKWALGHANGLELVLTGPAMDKRIAPLDWRAAVKKEIETLRQMGVTVRQGPGALLMLNMLRAAVCAVEPVMEYVKS